MLWKESRFPPSPNLLSATEAGGGTAPLCPRTSPHRPSLPPFAPQLRHSGRKASAGHEPLAPTQQGILAAFGAINWSDPTLLLDFGLPLFYTREGFAGRFLGASASHAPLLNSLAAGFLAPLLPELATPPRQGLLNEAGNSGQERGLLGRFLPRLAGHWAQHAAPSPQASMLASWAPSARGASGLAVMGPEPIGIISEPTALPEIAREQSSPSALPGSRTTPGQQGCALLPWISGGKVAGSFPHGRESPE